MLRLGLLPMTLALIWYEDTNDILRSTRRYP